MGGPYDALPFPRGQCYGQGISTSLVTYDATFGASLIGTTYRVRDETAEGGYKVLRVVQNNSGSAMLMQHLCKGFTATAAGYGRLAIDIAAAGNPCKPIDDTYVETYSVPAYDLFYVVDEGLCKINKPTDGGSAQAVGTPVYSNGSGEAWESTAGLGFVVGLAAKASLDADTEMYVMVKGGLGSL